MSSLSLTTSWVRTPDGEPKDEPKSATAESSDEPSPFEQVWAGFAIPVTPPQSAPVPPETKNDATANEASVASGGTSGWREGLEKLVGADGATALPTETWAGGRLDAGLLRSFGAAASAASSEVTTSNPTAFDGGVTRFDAAASVVSDAMAGAPTGEATPTARASGLEASVTTRWDPATMSAMSAMPMNAMPMNATTTATGESDGQRDAGRGFPSERRASASSATATPSTAMADLAGASRSAPRATADLVGEGPRRHPPEAMMANDLLPSRADGATEAHRRSSEGATLSAVDQRTLSLSVAQMASVTHEASLGDPRHTTAERATTRIEGRTGSIEPRTNAIGDAPARTAEPRELPRHAEPRSSMDGPSTTEDARPSAPRADEATPSTPRANEAAESRETSEGATNDGTTVAVGDGPIEAWDSRAEREVARDAEGLIEGRHTAEASSSREPMAAQAEEPVHEARRSNVERLEAAEVHAARASVKHGVTAVTSIPELGRLWIDARGDGAMVDVRIVAEDARVAEAVSASRADMRGDLRSADIALGDFSVRAGSAGAGGGSGQRETPRSQVRERHDGEGTDTAAPNPIATAARHRRVRIVL